MERAIGLVGLGLILGLSYFFSADRRAIRWRPVIWGLLLQFILALLVLRGEDVSAFFFWIPLRGRHFLLWLTLQAGLFWLLARAKITPDQTLEKIRRIFGWALVVQFGLFLLKFNLVGRSFEAMRDRAADLLAYSRAGSSFVFGPLGSAGAMTEVFGPALGEKVGAVTVLFAFQILPTIIFVAALFAVLYYIGLMQPIVRASAWVMRRTMGASGAECLNVSANIFMGQTEAPLTILPFLGRLTRSELFTIMVSGMAHTSAGILLAYVAVGGVDAKHLLTAIIMTSPGSILLAKLWFPETETPLTATGTPTEPATTTETADTPVNVIDAAARGASNGLTLALNVAAMLIAFIALIALFNGLLGGLRAWIIQGAGTVGLDWLAAYLPATLQQMLGWVFAPVAFLLGVPWHEATTVGNLLGTRLVLNEFVAFIDLGQIKDTLSPRSLVIATYALCGFANLSSIAIQVGGIGALIPERRKTLADLGLRAVLVGTMANLMSAAIAGLLV